MRGQFFQPEDFDYCDIPFKKIKDTVVDKANLKVVPLITQIAELHLEIERLRARCRLIGYACDKHDLTHALSCAACTEELREENSDWKKRLAPQLYQEIEELKQQHERDTEMIRRVNAYRDEGSPCP